MIKMLPGLIACLVVLGCEDLGYIEKTKYEALQEQLKKEQEQSKKAQDELTKAREQIAECQAHKYQIYHEAWRTWRLDSVTGKTCILLTNEQDWKKTGTTEQGCECQEALDNPNNSYEYLDRLGCFGKHKGTP